MFEIVKRGLLRDLNRVVSDTVLSRDDFMAVCDRIGSPPVSARKVGFVAARQALKTEDVSTQWEGEETTNSAQVGDWVVTNLARDKQVLRDVGGNANIYVITENKFPELYTPDGSKNPFGEIYRATGEVLSVFLAGGFDVTAPWGEQQVARSGYLILNGDDVYGNQTETFRATYERAR